MRRVRHSPWRIARKEARGDDRGQMLPIMVISIFAAIALTLALLQVGSAHVLERRAQTAADAAALAAAERWHNGLGIGPGFINFTGDQMAYESAEQLASENDATVVGYESTGWGSSFQVTVTVETDGEVVSGPIAAVTSRKARSTSTAGVGVTVIPLEGSVDEPRPLAELAREAGVSVSSDSALNRYAGESCTTGVDTDNLSNAMKIAILRVEAQLGEGLRLESGFMTRPCAEGAGYNAPDLSPAIQGDQIQLEQGEDAPDQDEAHRLLNDLGLCGTGNTFIASSSLACDADALRRSVSITPRLEPNP